MFFLLKQSSSISCFPLLIGSLFHSHGFRFPLHLLALAPLFMTSHFYLTSHLSLLPFHCIITTVTLYYHDSVTWMLSQPCRESSAVFHEYRHSLTPYALLSNTAIAPYSIPLGGRAFHIHFGPALFSPPVCSLRVCVSALCCLLFAFCSLLSVACCLLSAVWCLMSRDVYTYKLTHT
jgi:hypothetical protein